MRCLYLCYCYARLRCEFWNELIVVIVVYVEYMSYPSSAQHFHAVYAGIVRDVRRALVAAYTSPCAVCDRVLLGVNCGDFVVITNHRRMRASREVSVVSLSYDSIISDDNTTNLKFLARRTCCCKRSQLFKIFAPCRSFFHSMV
jgi:hypothetical protein